jgi:hypothetical protein
MSFSIQKVYYQLTRLSFGRERALRVGPLRGFSPTLLHSCPCRRHSIKTGVVFVGLCLINRVMKLNIIFFEKIPTFWRTKLLSLSLIASVLAELFKKQNPSFPYWARWQSHQNL